MTTVWKSLATAVLSLVFAGDAASSYTYPGRPNCPWANPTHTWAKYLNQEYGDAEPYFSILFSRDVGDIQGGTCYTITFLGNGNWSGAGKIRGMRESKREVRQGGNPANYEINVWGAMFTYNEAGEVTLTADGQPAGQMYCHIGSECWK